MGEDDKYDFSELSEEETALLVPLPYRVGYFISVSDQTGGEESDTAEQEALETMITSYAQDYCKSEFVQRLMERTVADKKDWESWQENSENVLEECKRVCYILKDRLAKKDYDYFRMNLYEIGTTVASIFQEEDPPSNFAEKMQDLFNMILGRKPRIYLPDGSYQNVDNISMLERAALAGLRQALDLKRAA